LISVLKIDFGEQAAHDTDTVIGYSINIQYILLNKPSLVCILSQSFNNIIELSAKYKHGLPRALFERLDTIRNILIIYAILSCNVAPSSLIMIMHLLINNARV